MRLKNNKGSISIFVLVALLFMTAFLIITYAININKSKTTKEKFDIIKSIYSYNDGEENAYIRAYTGLRKQNAGTFTKMSDVETPNQVELTKIFEGKLDNYRIYGNLELREADYIKAGMLLWYDGINNDGVDSHNANATVWKDLSGNYNDGVFHNMGTATGYYDENEKGYVFLHNNSYIETSYNLGISGSQAHTIELVVKFFENPDTLSRGALWFGTAGATTGYSEIVSYDKTSRIFKIGYINNSVCSNSSYQKEGETFNFSYSKDNSATIASRNTSIVKMYLNGSLIQSTNTGGNINVNLINSKIQLGRSWQYQNQNRTMYGIIKAVRVYNRELSSTELLYNYKLDEARYNIGNLGLEVPKSTKSVGNLVEDSSNSNYGKYQVQVKSVKETNRTLPEEYQQVEYLKSYGTQYINTGVDPTSTLTNTWRYEVDINSEKATSEYFGANFWANFSVKNDNYVCGTYTTPAAVRHKIAIECINNSQRNYYVDNTKVSEESINFNNYYGNRVFYLFAISMGTGNSTLYSKSTLYNCKIWNNNDLIRNFIPCYRKSDNVAGMYDTVNDVFYTNSGTGTFIPGPIPIDTNTVTDIYLNDPLRKVEDYVDYIDFASKKVIRNVGVIQSYAGETITTPYISSTGALDIGATVYYGLTEPTEETVSLPDIPIYEDYTKIEVLTDILPSKIEAEYKGYTTGE